MKPSRITLAFLLPLFASVACGSPPSDPTGTAANALSSASDSWCHDNLGATDGTKIAVDYQTQGGFNSAGSFTVSPLWINVSRADLSSSDLVRVVLLDIAGNTGALVQTQQMDLTFAEPGRFTGQTTADTSLNDFQQVAVVIDGAWLTDPVSNSSNFQFNLGDGFPDACGTDQGRLQRARDLGHRQVGE